MVVCGECKYRNTLGHVFCTQCGAKLDLEAAARQEQAAARVAVFKARAIRFLLLDLVLLVVVVTALALWPAAGEAERGEDKHFQTAKVKIVVLDKGASQAETFSEPEINAVLADRLKKRLEEGGKAIEVRVRPGLATVTVRSGLGPWNLGAFSVGPVPFTYSITGRPGRDGTRFVFLPLTGAVGHLPLWGPLKDRVTGPIAKLFEGQDHMRGFMDRVAGFELGDGTVAVTMGIKNP